MTAETKPVSRTHEDFKTDAVPTKNAVLIINAKSRQGQEWFTRAQQYLRDAGVTLNASIALEDPSQLSGLVQKYIADGEKAIIVGGGDGSFSGVVDYFAGTDAVLGVLPLGTVNDFARNLEIPADIETACRIIAQGRTARIDLGRANGNYFTITASVGFSAVTQTALSPGLKKRLGPLGYLAAALIALRRLTPFQITVRSERGEQTLSVVQAGVINGHTWMGGKVDIPSVDLQSGGLAFYAVPSQQGIGAYLRMARQLMRSRFFHINGLIAFRTHDVTVECETPQHVVVDGDLSGESPVRFQIAPRSLRVFVPESFLENPEATLK